MADLLSSAPRCTAHSNLEGVSGKYNARGLPGTVKLPRKGGENLRGRPSLKGEGAPLEPEVAAVAGTQKRLRQLQWVTTPRLEGRQARSPGER